MITDHHKKFESVIRSISQRHELWRVFSDFCEMGAISLYNAFVRNGALEKRYLELAGRYDPGEIKRLPELLAITVNALEEKKSDFLGEMFMTLGLSSHWKGQFFTPYHVCLMMAKITLTDIRKELAAKPFVRVMEPAVGGGAMVIALVEAMMEEKIPYHEKVHVTAIDISPTAAHMAFIQLSLLHVPAIVCIGDSLTMEISQEYRTFSHFLGFWESRLENHRKKADQPDPGPAEKYDQTVIPPEIKPAVYDAIRNETPVQMSLFVF